VVVTTLSYTKSIVDMSGSGQESLFRQLRDARIKCPLNEEQQFLPLDIMDKVITEENVRHEISGKFGALLDRKLPSKTVKHAKKVFAILVEIGEPRAMKDLFSDGLTDEHLPLSRVGESNKLRSKQGKEFPSFVKWKTEQRVADFIEKQWIFLAPVLDTSGHHIELESKHPLPFVKMDVIGYTKTSSVYESELHQAHFKRKPLEKYSHQVATKEIRDRELFEQEKRNLDTIQEINHEHLVKHFATCRKGTNYYVIFPWASGGSLKDFWKRQDGQTRDATLKMWSLRQMLGLAMALEALHGVNCRHGDLKPENILHFHGTTATDGKLVIADVGISKTHQKDTQFRHEGTNTRATTPSYEAPEAITNASTPRARRYDIWSIGCIFLEFAIWILHDREAIRSFGEARYGPSFEFYFPSRDSCTSSTPREIHPAVTSVIKTLRHDPRCSGNTEFGNFIDIISEDLLHIDVEKRVSATELVEKLRKVVENMEADPRCLFNEVSLVPEKLRFPRGTRTGAHEPRNGTISEETVVGS
jgi:serine/threonine protein kinase